MQHCVLQNKVVSSHIYCDMHPNFTDDKYEKNYPVSEKRITKFP